MKQEPSTYSWAAFVKDGTTAWTGIRNFQARNHLRGMSLGDKVYFYHSGEERQIVGLAQVVRAPYSDPTATEGDWTAVDLKVLTPLARPVTLSEIKADEILKQMPLVKFSRLSVTPVSAPQFERVLEKSGTRIPRRAPRS